MNLWCGDAFELLRKYGGRYALRLPKYKYPYFVIKALSYFVPHVGGFMPMYAKEIDISNKKSIEKLGMEYSDLAKHVKEMMEDMIAKGFLEECKKWLQLLNV